MSYDEELNEEGRTKGKVLDLSQAKEKRKGKADKPQLKEIYRCYVDVMQGKWSLWPKFPKRFHILGGLGGGYVLLEENDNREVAPVTEDRVIRAIMDYSQGDLRKMPDMLLTFGQAKECLGSFIGYSHDLETEPTLVAGISEQGLTYRRLPFDPSPSLEAITHAPTFAEALSRMTEPDAVCAFIGSLFDNDADLSQYLWIYGQGGEGKSSVASVIAEIFGSAAWHSQPPSQNDRFWSYNLIGKRLVIFPDCNNYSFVTTGPFKSLTGGDKQSLEPKGKAHVQMRLKTKFLFLSNRVPNISTAPSDIRRAIICDMKPFEGKHDPNYQDRLNSEIEPIVNYCLAKYQEIAGRKRLIPTVTDRVKDLAEENEAYLESVIERTFDFDKEAFMKAGLFQDLLRMQGIKDNTLMGVIKAKLQSKYDIITEGRGSKHQGIRGYWGLRPKTAFRKIFNQGDE